MPEYRVNAARVPTFEVERLASPLLRIVREAFEDPQIQREFEEWKAKKAKEAKSTA